MQSTSTGSDRLDERLFRTLYATSLVYNTCWDDPAASRYDHFRARLLHGREELIDRLPTPFDGVVVELGGGTGSNIERFGPRMRKLRRYILVDLCEALFEQA